MAEFEKTEFKFPDEIEQEIEIEVEDDMPPEDRANSTPMPEDIVKDLEEDDLEAYSNEAKTKLHQLKKVWNDERRAKEQALREQEEATRVAQQLIEENKRLKGRLSEGEKVLVSSVKNGINRELEDAKREFKEAYDSGDGDRLAEAQEKLADVKYKANQMENYKNEFDNPVEEDYSYQQPQQRLEPKTQAWLDKNKWYGVDEDMSYLAMGVHRRLEKEGVPLGSDYYFQVIDAEMQKRFPDKFGIKEINVSEPESKPSAKTSTVVASATRSTAPKKVRLNQTQLALAKKFKLTPEQYARELTKLEN
jgi:myosin heavy subunit